MMSTDRSEEKLGGREEREPFGGPSVPGLPCLPVEKQRPTIKEPPFMESLPSKGQAPMTQKGRHYYPNLIRKKHRKAK